MKSPLSVYWMPRVRKDIKNCVDFISRQPWGKPKNRLDDILQGIAEVVEFPRLYPVRSFRPQSGLSLRRHFAAQFVIIYAYIDADEEFPNGVVSIRAIRHRRVKDVFMGVRQPEISYRPADYGWSQPF